MRARYLLPSQTYFVPPAGSCKGPILGVSYELAPKVHFASTASKFSFEVKLDTKTVPQSYFRKKVKFRVQDHHS